MGFFPIQRHPETFLKAASTDNHWDNSLKGFLQNSWASWGGGVAAASPLTLPTREGPGETVGWTERQSRDKALPLGDSWELKMERSSRHKPLPLD